jgi:lysophospholipase L1-like esterase
MPDILGIMLGCNDFRTTVLNDSAFATWKTNMDTLLTSVRSAATALGKTVKIAICLPVTETASANNSALINPAFQRANMFDARRRIIEAFDNNTYSDNNIDVVDTGTAVDGDFGFAMSEIKPFSDYAGTQREMYSGNVPHPDNARYSQLGIRFEGYIQSIR